MLSVADSAKIMNVSTSRVRALIAQGALPAHKVGRAWVLREEDVMQRVALRPNAGRPRLCTETGGPQPTPAETPEELRKLYEMCKKAFAVRPGADILAGAAEYEEASFYVVVADFFLQQKQRELVKRGVF